jgi:hypothetical protein
MLSRRNELEVAIVPDRVARRSWSKLIRRIAGFVALCDVPPGDGAKRLHQVARVANRQIFGFRGVTDNEIRLGISAPFTGSAKELGIQMKLGIGTAFNLSLKQNFLCRKLPRDYLGLQQSAAHIDWNQRDAL